MQNEKIKLQDLHNKIQTLETKSAFQEDALNQLNTVIIEQQQQIGHLEIVIEALRGTVQSINSTAASPVSVTAEKPPHY